VDTGIPGLQLADVRTVLITHHDYDHIGSLPGVYAATRAEVLAAPLEIPYIQGGRRAQKPPPERVEGALQTLPEGQRAYFQAAWTHVQPPVPVAGR